MSWQSGPLNVGVDLALSSAFYAAVLASFTDGPTSSASCAPASRFGAVVIGVTVEEFAAQSLKARLTRLRGTT
jgi:hypothetical protein